MLKKADVILAVILILLGMIPLLFSINGGGEVTVSHDGEQVYKGSLAEDRTLEIDGKYHNTVIIENGGVRFLESDCPNGDCVRAGTHSSGVVACAPNGVIVTISGSDADAGGEVDTVAE